MLGVFSSVMVRQLVDLITSRRSKWASISVQFSIDLDFIVLLR